jgi:hypothetical protein
MDDDSFFYFFNPSIFMPAALTCFRPSTQPNVLLGFVHTPPLIPFLTVTVGNFWHEACTAMAITSGQHPC